MKGTFRRSLASLATSALMTGALVSAVPALAENGPTSADIASSATNTGAVLTNGMGPWGQRFSTLTQVNTATVKNLVPAFASSLGGEKQRGQ